ncbi:efflux transporter outer membrane subunit [Sphingomonas solaris]|uniref:Efflux transporter outer membrane subunit n=1 Tax=Alterirhizorhabdus solaris TaxID=2529389 RepID=A0A558R4U1_9SPHN|nr:efflux transporter outer membrane subunit [Sphingomonas solaris]TVV74379.1 efflux transporter outer membrane subunit [Sphingomonas solaris]
MRNIAILLAATALSACSLAPPHTRGPLPVAPAYQAEYRPEIGTRRATAIPWRTFFTDPRLQAIIAIALQNNRDLKVSVARIAEARGQYRIQGADRLPTLNLGGSATRNRIGVNSLGANGIVTGTDGGTTGGVSGFTYNQYSVNVGVSSFELDFWGRVANLTAAARANYLSTVVAERAFRLSLIRDVAMNYLQAREYIERIEIAEATVKSRIEGLRIAKLRLDAGVTSALDYRQAETLLTQAETALAALRLQLAQTRDAVAVLLGQPIPADLPPALATAQQPITRDIAPGLPSELLDNRPDILSAEEQLRAARANVGAARAAFFPSITLTGSAGYTSSALGDLFKSGSFLWNVGPSLSLPIFDWGRREGNLSVARARADIAVATYEKTVQTAFQEVADALAGRRYLAEQVEAQQRATLAQRKLAELARSRYRNGVANYIEVLDAERNLFEAEQALISARRAELDNLVSLYIALGGGLDGTPEPAPVAAR